MKQIKVACIEQILHFQLKENIEHNTAVQMVQEKYVHYKYQMNKEVTRYKLVDEKTLPDGSIQIRIKKQYNTAPVGNFLLTYIQSLSQRIT